MVVTGHAEEGDKELQRLEPGQPIERELAGGEAHSYSVNLSANQYLHIVVDQKGIDVVVSLFGLDGQRVVEVDSPNGVLGTEPLWFVADAPGTYRVEVRALEEDACRGRYQVKIEERRVAVPQDSNRIAAQMATARGEELFAVATIDSRRHAIDVFESAHSRWRASGEKLMQAITLARVGNVYDWLGEPEKALPYYSQSLALARAGGDRRAEAERLDSIGLIYKSLGELQKALDFFQQTLPLRRALSDRAGEATTLHHLAAAYMLLSEPQKALDYYNRALQLRRDVGDRSGEAMTLDGLGSLYDWLGEPEKALSFYNQALLILRGVGNRREEATALNNIGFAYASSGDAERAFSFYKQALALRQALEDRRGQAATLKSLGSLYGSSGEAEKALSFYNQALRLVHAMGDRREEAITLNGIGAIYDSRGEYQMALDDYSQALRLMREVEDRRGESLTLFGLARVERHRGNLGAARDRIEEALGIVESLRSKVASQELRASFFASVQQYIEFYLNLLMQLDRMQPGEGHDVLALEASERARARSLLEMLAESRVNIRQGVAPVLLDKERSLQQMLNAKAERQTRLLNSRHTEEQASAIKKETDELLAQYSEVEAQIRSMSPRYSALTQPVPLSLKEIQQELDPDMLLLEYALTDEHSYLWAVTRTTSRGFALPKRAEIEAAARRVYELLTARNRQVRFETAEEKRERIAKADAEYPQAAALLSRMILSPVESEMGKKRLLVVSDGALNYLPFAALPTPSADALTVPRIETTGDDSSQVARTTTHTASAARFVPLVVDHEIVSLPSASMLAVLRREMTGRTAASKLLAVVADPVFDKTDERVRASIGEQGVSMQRIKSDGSRAIVGLDEDELMRSARESGIDEEDGRLSRLPYTRREANEILALVSPAERKRALDFDASRATATSPELGEYRFVHFATHGLLNSHHPELSGIVLSLVDRQGMEQDGFLRVNEVFNLKLPAELVVLSGCRTGLGKEIKGEGIVGLTRGFMYAGAARVVVSLWGISDEASAELMIRLYKGMLGKERQRPAAALRAAQVSIWEEKRWQAPYYWAAFTLQGEPR